MPSASPTELVLDLRAEYEKTGDTVLVYAFVVDPTLELGFPGLVKSGTCQLLYRGNLIREILFDKRFGNGPEGLGDFVFQFSHPSAITNLQVRIEMLMDVPTAPGNPPGKGGNGPPPGGGNGPPPGGNGPPPGGGGPIPVFLLAKTVPVTKGETPYLPLERQAGTGSDLNGELRSKKRVDEELL